MIPNHLMMVQIRPLMINNIDVVPATTTEARQHVISTNTVQNLECKFPPIIIGGGIII